MPRTSQTGVTTPRTGDAPELSVVVPAYNEARGIAEAIREIEQRIAEIGVPFEIIVVSDGSEDATFPQAQTAAGERVTVLGYDENQGKGYALRIGSQAARGRWIAWVDADLDLDPRGVAGLLAMARRGDLDVVVGSKRHPASRVDYPARRRVHSWLYQQLVRILFRLDVRDTQVGMKVFRADVMHEVLPVVLVKRYAFDLEILAVARAFGFARIAEGPVHLDYRFSGTGMNWRAIRQALWDTAAVFYRLRIRRYYQHRRVAGASRPVLLEPLADSVRPPAAEVDRNRAARIDHITRCVPEGTLVAVGPGDEHALRAPGRGP